MAVSALRIAAAVLLVAPLAAQRTWIVDAFNGPGTDFFDLPPALAAARDGDTIPAIGRWVVPLAIPATAPPGLPVTFQALVGTRLTPPATIVIQP